jgi:DNA helicase-2/ATP-dependent DNA helicase PcrA
VTDTADPAASSAPGSPAPTADAVLAALDPEQREAAQAIRGPVCILAGAGTGKTRTITHRIAYAVHAGMWRPNEVLAVTFTTRAAGEMRSRLARLGVPGVQARTFHSAALRQARYFWPQVHNRDLPAILDSKIPLVAEAAARNRVSLDNAGRRDLASEIEWAKVSNVDPEHYAEHAARVGRTVGGLEPGVVARLFAAYEELRRERDRIDLEDVLLCTAGLLATDARVAATVRSQYRHLVVDECQDVSPLQQALLELWLGKGRDVCVVGDPTQTIYSFAGATSQHLREFARRYTDATVVRLHRDYRSTPEVVRSANALIARADAATRRTHVPLVSQRKPGPAVTFSEYPDEVAEAAAVAAAIGKLVADGTRPADIGVLYRINAQSEALEQALADARVPYQVRGGERFFDRREVKEAVALLRGQAVADRAAGSEQTSEAAVDASSPDAGAALPQTVRAILAGAGYTAEPPASTGRMRERWESLAALAALADDAAADGVRTLGEFVAVLAERAEQQHAPGLAGVTLSTLHAAKGLEWERVFLVGLHEGMLPSAQARGPEQIDEERRLLYVGMTRAATGLALSWSLSRSPGGAGRRRPSRFLDAVRPAGSSIHDGSDRADRTGRSEPGARSRRQSRTPLCRVCNAPLTDAPSRRLGRCSTCPSNLDEELLARLKQWRRDTAHALKQPAFCVFTDAALVAIAEARPGDDAALSTIPGVGARKLAKFGADVIGLCSQDLSSQELSSQDR